MSLGWVIAGSIGQALLGFQLCMLAVFAGASIGNGHNIGKFQANILGLSMIGLPLSCALSGGIVIYLYKTGSSAWAYWWYAMPLVLVVLYFKFALKIYR